MPLLSIFAPYTMTCAVDDAMGDAMGDALWACLVVTLNFIHYHDMYAMIQSCYSMYIYL